MNTSTPGQDNQSLVISYLTLRKAIGFLGLLLPVILFIGGWIDTGHLGVEPSISDYYYTNMRNGFVGVMCAVALFLFAYLGYDPIDRIAGNLGCVFALGVAFFPTTPALQDPDITGTLHFVFAVLFFATLVFFSLFLFTRTGNTHQMTERKKTRNTIYHFCGYIMIASILCMALYFFVLENKYDWLDDAHPVFFLESLALVAFGVSWLVKGEFILKDLNHKKEV